MCIYAMSVRVHVHTFPWRPEKGIRAPATEVIAGCELLKRSVQTQTYAIWKSNKYS